MAARTATKKLPQKVRKTATKHAKRALVPHRSNQFKPFLIRRGGLFIILIAVLVVQVSSQIWVRSSSVLGDDATINAPTLLAGTNQVRQREGLPELTLSTQLSEAAYLKAQDMLEKQYWAHTSPDGTKPWQWFSTVGYRYSVAGENLARNFSSSQSAIEAWMSSPSHRENIMKAEYRDVGFSVVQGEMAGRTVSLIVALYASPAATVASAVQGAQNFVTPQAAPLGVTARIGIALQQMSPAVLGSVVLLLMAAGVALVAHAFRAQIPKYLQSTWQRHHGWVKAVGLSCVAVAMVFIYGTGGQI